MNASAPATRDAQELVWLAIDAAAEVVAEHLATPGRSAVTLDDVARHAGPALPVLMAILHGDATPAAELVRERAEEFLTIRP